VETDAISQKLYSVIEVNIVKLKIFIKALYIGESGKGSDFVA